MNTQITGQVVKEYLERFPNTSSHTLAKKIYTENKGLFATEDSARSAVRYYRGASGDRQRKSVKLEKPITPIPTLPESYAETKPIIKLRKADNNILLISDLHVPYHDNTALQIALDYGIERQCNTVIINGDLIDFHGLSRFEKDPRKRTVKQEFDAAIQILDYIRFCFPTARIMWIEGNHDARYPKWLMNHAVHFFDDEYYSLQERLQLKRNNIEFVRESTLVYAGKLAITHGHLIIRGIFAPVNTARGAFLKAKQSVIVGHAHQVSEHTEKNLSGDIITCFSQGCLCDLQPDYDPLTNKHAHGFAHIIVKESGHYAVTNKRIHKGELL